MVIHAAHVQRYSLQYAPKSRTTYYRSHARPLLRVVSYTYGRSGVRDDALSPTRPSSQPDSARSTGAQGVDSRLFHNLSD